MLGYFSFYQIAPFKAPFFFSANLSIRCFRRGKQYTVQKPITRSLNNNFTLESTPSRIFLLSFDFFFNFFFLLSCSALANCSIPGFIFFLSTREQKCVSALNSVKNVAIQILGRGPNWPHKPYRCEPWHSPSARESTQISTFTMAQQRAWARFGVFSKRNCYFWFRFRP